MKSNRTNDTSPFWAPDRHADRRPFLLARGRIVAALRRYFEEREFVEVDAAILQISPGNEAHLHGFVTELIGPDGAKAERYLHTSPEFAMKKLLAAGERRIVDFARVFRNRERGPLHAPEFTMVEWYRAGEPYESVMADATALLAEAAERAGTKQLTYRDRSADPYAEAERLTVAEAFDDFAGIDLLSTIERRGRSRPVGRTGKRTEYSPRRRRQLVGYLQPYSGREDRAQSRSGTADDPL